MATYNIDSFQTITNIVNIATMDANNVTISGDTATYAENVVAMLQKALTKPIANHKYYCRCYQLKSAGSTVSDSRIEYFLEDAPDQKMTFGTFESIPDDGEWHLTSDVLSLSSPNDGEWVFRAFAVNGTGTMKRKEFLLIDLTQDFGSGHEPSKIWCDLNIPYFAGTTAFVNFNLSNGDIINCPYSGGEKILTIPQRCLVKLECWGAKGGYGVDVAPIIYGGNGGYSSGEHIINSPKTLYLNCGGHGQDVDFNVEKFTNAYNGGGKGAVIGPVLTVYGCSGGGGGATHIALSTGVLKTLENAKESVIMVAGGGGGGYDRGTIAYRDGGKGGGTNGGYGSGNESTNAATQTSAGQNAGFGYGANVNSTYRGGAGGSGWYGGAAGYSNDAGGNGGSGYVNPSLLNAQTTIEATSSNPDTTQNGYIRITVLDVFGVNIERKYSDELYHPSSHCFLKKNGSWHEIENVFYKTGGQWKPNR